MPLPTSTPPFEPVLILVSKAWVESASVAPLLSKLKVFSATREDAWRYRNSMTIVFEGYADDKREVIDIPEVRNYLRLIYAKWPEWAYFISYDDDSTLKILLSSVLGSRFPGNGQAEIDTERLPEVMVNAFDGMNPFFDKYGFPEDELRVQSDAFIAKILQMSGIAP